MKTRKLVQVVCLIVMVLAAFDGVAAGSFASEADSPKIAFCSSSGGKGRAELDEFLSRYFSVLQSECLRSFCSEKAGFLLLIK